MRKNTLKKAMAVMISATMLVTGYTVVSAEGFTDAEALAEMDAFTTGDEAVYVEEVQPEAAQTEEVQPEQTQTRGSAGGCTDRGGSGRRASGRRISG